MMSEMLIVAPECPAITVTLTDSMGGHFGQDDHWSSFRKTYSDSESDSGCTSNRSDWFSVANGSVGCPSSAASDCGQCSDSDTDVDSLCQRSKCSDTSITVSKVLKKQKATSWHTIMMDADYVLELWETGQSRSRSKLNTHPLRTTQICPCPELSSDVLRGKYRKVPLRRYDSVLCFNANHEDSSSMFKRDSKRQSVNLLDDIMAVKAVRQGPKKEPKVQVFVEPLNFVNGHLVRANSVRYVQSPDPVYKLFEAEPSSCLPARERAAQLVTGLKLTAGQANMFAMKVTSIDQGLFMQLRPLEVMTIVLGGNNCQPSCTMSTLETITDFGKLVSMMLKNVTLNEITADGQATQIASVIEVACALRRLRNWHSLSIVVKALQCPKVYQLDLAWALLKTKWPMHFRDFLTLSKLVHRSDVHLLRSKSPAIPSLDTLIKLFRLHCSAKWDLTENKPRWTEPPTLTRWLEKQLAGLCSQFVRKESACSLGHLEMAARESRGKSMLNGQDDPVRFIPLSSLPSTWTQNPIQNVPSEFKRDLVECFVTSFNYELNLISHYGLFKFDLKTSS
ncbi:hypothetical protein HDE_01863 [Halotydeus destructor]|nr:hypothetical protein HDE_01863 [Halotydeus destructor]